MKANKAQKTETEKIKQIAEMYHDWPIISRINRIDQVCDCCDRNVLTTTTIEHDNPDKNPNLNVCTSCYEKIVNYWKKNNSENGV